jgi:3-hydroxyisobutyrate dehydrogenase-like beta-hydroxyacid dehydrogenase
MTSYFGDEEMKTGFIGLGHMGAAMAANLVKAGHDVMVFNRSPGKTQALLELGAHEAARIADACNGEVVITMLADDTALAHVVLAEGGVIASLRKGAIHVSMSTISVALSNELAQAHAEAGQRFVAAPVFGRPDMAAVAKLYIVAAGDFAAVDECKSLFDALGQKNLSDQH